MSLDYRKFCISMFEGIPNLTELFYSRTSLVLATVKIYLKFKNKEMMISMK